MYIKFPHCAYAKILQKSTVPDRKWIFPSIAQVKNTKNGSDNKGTNPVQSQDRHQCPSKEQLLLQVYIKFLY